MQNFQGNIFCSLDTGKCFPQMWVWIENVLLLSVFSFHKLQAWALLWEHLAGCVASSSFSNKGVPPHSGLKFKIFHRFFVVIFYVHMHDTLESILKIGSITVGKFLYSFRLHGYGSLILNSTICQGLIRLLINNAWHLSVHYATICLALLQR